MRKKEGESKCENCLPCGNVTKLVGHHPCIAFPCSRRLSHSLACFFPLNYLRVKRETAHSLIKHASVFRAYTVYMRIASGSPMGSQWDGIK